ncbi:MAG: sugar transferase [Rubrivivax sp.]
MNSAIPQQAADGGLRLLDLLLGTVALALLVLLLPLLALAIRLDSRGSIFFRQARLGQHGRVFHVVKFRTMVSDAPPIFNADGSRFVGKIDARVTRVGRFLRLGLDELPQVFNVFRGEMSFIGPRPDDVHALQNYQGAEWLKLADRPGLTGLAQVCGRNDIPWRERIRYDIYYHYRRNLALDLQIVLRTIALLLKIGIQRPLVTPAQVDELLARPDAAADGLAMQQQVEAAQR